MMVRDYLAGRVEGRQVEVRIDRFNRVDKWGRLLGDIVADGINLSEEMLSLGLVTPFERRREGEIVSVDKILDVKQWF
jgi:endonuclease YncB( thermonuclease family)